MRVVLFTSEEPLYLPPYIQPILAAYGDAVDRLVVAPFDAPLRRQVREYLGMYGVRAGARMGLSYLGASALGALPRSVTRRMTGRHYSVAGVARAHDVPVERVPDVSDPGFVDRMRALDPEVLLSVVAGQRLPPALLDCATEALNLHGSLLPNYRGRATAFWPLYYGDDRTGVTAHRMTDRFDAGPVIERRAFPIEDDDTVDSVYRKLSATGAALAVDLLDAYPELPEPTPNETTKADYHGVPDASERRTFRERGGEFL
ncbi:methionyl-tRNA formyltransferase [Halorarius halobius]|uniref:methionyl-tRNA formyltransferase n=1 Tax=Halorarius halobius TaxID=2962671 RepID=UPI0020CF1BFF|nr:formyltransferase family protein [Halorarius halobius]